MSCDATLLALAKDNVNDPFIVIAHGFNFMINLQILSMGMGMRACKFLITDPCVLLF